MKSCKAPTTRCPSTPSSQAGFALVVTVSILVLLAVIAVGLLSLSTVTVRASAAGGAQAEARANARMALMLAIGELQKAIGPDQRVTANGSIVSESPVTHPHLLGVWDSWKAGPESGGPDGASTHNSIQAGPNRALAGLHPTYEPQRQDHFRTWLASLRPAEKDNPLTPAELSLGSVLAPEKDSEAVQLVGAGTLGQGVADNDIVGARLLETDRGRFAWWVGDESQKARVSGDPFLDAEETPTLAGEIFRHSAPGSFGITTLEGLTDLTEEDERQLTGLPTLATLDLLESAEDLASQNFHDVTLFSNQVLADVREGGLKRDLTTLLERPIREGRTGMKPREMSDDHMLYKFAVKDSWATSDDPQEAVPIHDLAAYYQLYDANRDGWKKGVQYDSPLLDGGPMITAPDFGRKSDDTRMYLRQYTSLYRQPVPIKIQFLLSMYAVPRDPDRINRSNPDTHKLHMGITPSVTLWNPTNLPMVMNLGDPNHYAHMFRLMNMPLNIKWIKNGTQFQSSATNHLTWLAQQSGGFKANIFSLYFSGTRPIVFEPGEVRVFSLPYRPGNMNFSKSDRFRSPEPHEVDAGWDPFSFLEMHRSERSGSDRHVEDNCITFGELDELAFEVSANNTELFIGSGMQFLMIQASYQQHGNPGRWDFRHYQHTSRMGRGTSTAGFNAELYGKVMPGRTGVIRSEARSCRELIARSSGRQIEPWPLLQVALMAGTETHESSNGGAFAGRKFASRPFLHATSIAPSYIDQSDNNSLYNYGWNWWVEEINSVLGANVQVTRDGRGYFGGGYTEESGTTHVVQQEVPVVPPLSIASLSHAHLGGFSVATEACAPGYQGLVNPWTSQSWQHVTATGQAGLSPHTLQAIGNSYAHPLIPPDKSHVEWERYYSVEDGKRKTVLADHSYLANKALWDEFFFSSISPQSADAEVFQTRRTRSAEEVAEGFFFGEETLPNNRMIPYTIHLDEDRLDSLFRKADIYRDGLADQIAEHLMVKGAFNVNSTSVEAWRSFFSSLRGKEVAYLDRGNAMNGRLDLDRTTPEGTPVSSFTLPNGPPTTGSPADPSAAEQWFSWRELTDEEINELAEAMVEQVKKRGPFLSLSDFVNRRLDSRDRELAVKGALQAALDDEDVSINEGFRDPARQITRSEASSMSPAFPEALEGPVAYGSAAYIDQADILRHFAGQITPRGDTFVIRAYGDSLDQTGAVRARAWCEAVVQRVPDYLDPDDAPYLAQADLTSETNKRFGRTLRVVGFRWIKQDDV